MSHGDETTIDADEPLDVGMLGYRFMGKAHSNALARLPMFFPDAPEVRRHTLIGRDEDALAEAADRFGFERTSTDWREVVDEVDAFYNLGPNHLHVEPSKAALEAGTHVLCEKPLAPTLEGAGELRDAAAASDAVAGCAFNYRFVPAIRYAKRLIDDGSLGEIRHVSGRYYQDWLSDPEAPWAWRMDEELAGSGALGDVGAHTLDLIGFLVNDHTGGIERLSGHLTTFTEERPVPGGDERRPVTVDDAYSAQAEFENGAMGTFEASRVAEGHKNDHSIGIHGTDGSIRFSLERMNELEVMAGDARGYETVLVTDESDPYVEAWWPPGHVLGWEHTFVHENYEFLTAVAEGGEFSPSFGEAYEVQRLLDAVQRSDESGEWVEV
ncbi:Gfo/Idh/MocA family protein [Halorarum salinum]|uniref:Gfo/Idh/MocA family oxidoreductase n=1 Tax=Halorarum salinum TaxID=2743089 RepID=A0A7D5LBI9_9EURY|nr:Gfo/Idh/MocA family oxidoreductase [Halobaculum salinum]QLG62631.1 Gfo/Idh/MocA family oxidoreductase [Halobaculum salinum]